VNSTGQQLQKQQDKQHEAELKKMLESYDPIIKSLRITIKNSVFYTPDHPICEYSLNNFKSTLDKYFLDKDVIEIGVFQNYLFFDRGKLKGSSEIYKDVANFLHARGLVSISFSRGVDLKELVEVFNFIREDVKTIREKGGILKYIPPTPHIKIKEMNYSALLSRTGIEEVSEEDIVVSEEEKIWQSLNNIANEAKFGKLPESKVELLVDFFKDTKKSTSALNKVYKDAATKLRGETVGSNIRGTIAKICGYFNKYASGEEGKDFKVNIMNVVEQLDPNLIGMMFENVVVDGRNFDLAEEITKDFSDSSIAGFLEPLISKEDSYNENLLKVFDKLVPDENRANNVATMVADKLFKKRIVNPDTLSKFQMSIREIFKNHPKSSFMSQMHQITVDAVINKKIDSLIYVAKLSPMINKFVQSMEDGKLKKEKIWLLLNILFLENDAEEFKKFSIKLTEVLPELLDSRDTERLREVLEFFTENTRTEQKKDERMAGEINEAINRITTEETLDSIISDIPEAFKEDLTNITYILNQAKDRSPGLLLDAFLQNQNPAHRNKFKYIFSEMKQEISEEVLNRLEYCKPRDMRDLFIILRQFNPEGGHLIAKKLITHENARIRWEALDGFHPRTNKERRRVLELFKTEKDKEVKKRVAVVLLKTKKERIIEILFKFVQRGFIQRRFLIKLVELCGRMRSLESFPHLKRILMKKPLFNTKRRDYLRITAATSLMRLQQPEAVSLVESRLNDRSKRLRGACEVMLKLDEKKMKKQMHGQMKKRVAYEV